MYFLLIIYVLNLILYIFEKKIEYIRNLLLLSYIYIYLNNYLYKQLQLVDNQDKIQKSLDTVTIIKFQTKKYDKSDYILFKFILIEFSQIRYLKISKKIIFFKSL